MRDLLRAAHSQRASLVRWDAHGTAGIHFVRLSVRQQSNARRFALLK